MKIKWKLKRIQKERRPPRLNLELLEADDVRNSFSTLVRNNFDLLMDEEPIHSDDGIKRLEREWSCLSQAITESATESVPKADRIKKQDWMTDEILDLMEERHQFKNTARYQTINNEIRKKCKLA